jgi:hypothetical protein
MQRNAEEEEPSQRQKSVYQQMMDSLTPAEQEEYAPIIEQEHARLRSDLYQRALDGEPRDEAWAAQTDAELRRGAERLDREVFPSTEIAATDCRSTLCRIEVRQQTLAEQAAFVGSMPLSMRAFGRKHDESAGEALGWTLFVVREGYSVPKLP